MPFKDKSSSKAKKSINAAHMRWAAKPENKAKVAAINKRYRDKNKEKLGVKYREYKKQPRSLFSQRARKFGITVDELTALIARHEGKCAICNSTHRLVVDHDHGSNEVRGILCTPCNLGLAHFKDTPEFMELAAQYLRRAKQAMAEDPLAQRRGSGDPHAPDQQVT